MSACARVETSLKSSHIYLFCIVFFFSSYFAVNYNNISTALARYSSVKAKSESERENKISDFTQLKI